MNTIHQKNLHSVGANFLQALALGLNIKKVDNTLDVPKADGIGSIKLYDASDGLSAVLFELELKNNAHIQTVINAAGAQKSLIIFAILTPKLLSIQKVGQPPCGSGLVFSSGDEKLELSIISGGMVKAVALIISEKWVREECNDINETDLLFMIPDLFCQKKSALCPEGATYSVFQTMAAIHNSAIIHRSPAFYIKAKTFSILSDILPGFRPEGVILTHDQELTHSRMLTIEKILDDHLSKNLPSISSIAKQAVLSESTLKRNFKQIYGVSIYEYYLQKKMQLARRMLDQQSIAVKEVAYMLGYEKTSNFIKAFKKYYELSPGSFRKKTIQ